MLIFDSQSKSWQILIPHSRWWLQCVAHEKGQNNLALLDLHPPVIICSKYSGLSEAEAIHNSEIGGEGVMIEIALCLLGL